MQVGEAQFLEVGDLRVNAVKVTGVAVHVADPAQHGIGEEPAAVRLFGCVNGLEVGGAFLPRAGRFED